MQGRPSVVGQPVQVQTHARAKSLLGTMPVAGSITIKHADSNMRGAPEGINIMTAGTF